MTRRMLLSRLALLALVPLLGGKPAWAGHELDNSNGKLNGYYVGDVKITEPDKEERVVKNVKFEIQDKYIKIYFQDSTVTARHDQIFTRGYKTEITAHTVENKTRYLVTYDGGMGD